MEPDSSHAMALGRLEGKVDILLQLQTANSDRHAKLDERVTQNMGRISTLEAQSTAKSDTGRFWLTTLSSGLAVIIAALALAKDFIK